MFPGVHIGAVLANVDALRQLTACLEPDAVPLSEASGLWLAFDRIERLAAGAKLLLARRVDESAVRQKAGDVDAGMWMARHGGTSVTAARIGLAASKRLAKLPATTQAVRRGELSVAQAEPLADAASRKPEEEARLLGAAREASLAELREECGRVKLRADRNPEERQRRIRSDRRLRQGKTSDGAWWLSGYGPVDDAAELNAVLGPIVDEIFREAHGEGRAEPRVLGCNRTDLEYDHRVDWAETRHTVLWELDGICGHHHHLKTHDGWALVAGTGKRAMVPPDDPRHLRHRGAGDIRAGPGQVQGQARVEAGDSSCLSEPESQAVAA